jgi:fimbrial isopeptide formation D2 family protein
VRPAALVNAQAAVDCETTHFTPGWSLEKRSDPDSGSEVDPGDQVTYTLTVTNTSAAVVDSAVVTDDLSSVLEYASLDSVPADASLSGTTLTWNVPTLQSGETAQLSYTVTVDDDAYDVSFANVATPGNGGVCTLCTTYHETPPEPDNPDEPNLPNTGGTSLLPLGLGAGFLITGALMLGESRRRRVREPVRKS